MRHVYILSESDHDDQFYLDCLEALTAPSYTLLPFRLRRGGGMAEARRKIPFLLQHIKHIGPVADTFFIIALDNDRAPIHPAHRPRPKLSKQDQCKPCRVCAMEALVREYLGARETWPIAGAIAVPVEMLESWLLLMCDGNTYGEESTLPMFATKRDAQALLYEHGVPPDQLKDLKRKEMEKHGRSTPHAFFHFCLSRLDIDDLCSRSTSFAHFKAQIDQWA